MTRFIDTLSLRNISCRTQFYDVQRLNYISINIDLKIELKRMWQYTWFALQPDLHHHLIDPCSESCYFYNRCFIKISTIDI